MRATIEKTYMLSAPDWSEHPPPARPLALLTQRELQVAELVADGQTNRQIGGELFLSVKTVERHLARIFSKLDISARAKLAAMVASDRPRRD